nr:ATP-binding cassette domain-containing protein [Pseudopedobacter sp.]
MLHFKNFQKRYYSNPIIQIDDLILQKGIYWIKGVNGSGKSTLLKSIAGILDFKGDIILNKEISIKKQPVAFRSVVNFAEAEPIFPEFLTGMEMVKLFESAKKGTKEQSEQLIAIFKMQDYIHERLGTYSSGMLKKLSLVLAFLGHPNLILLDEPLITLDTEALGILCQLIIDKYHEGISFILSSHQDLNHELFPQSSILMVENKSLNFIE